MPDVGDRIGVVLLNVGTPDAPRPRDVRRYLREFLGDPRVLDMNPFLRRLLLELVILPFRPRRSAAAYRKIWLEGGSPLLVHARAHASALSRALGPRFQVALGMRYGHPSIASALEGLRRGGIDRIVLFPLFPQYGSATTGTSVAEALRLATAAWNVPAFAVVPPFYDDAGFLAAFAAVARPVLETRRADHVLFSYHGLPERHVRKSAAPGAACLDTEDCCREIVAMNRSCYRAQCLATTRGLADRLGLGDGGHSTSFQSRLGRAPWIGPHTDETVRSLARSGVRRLAVLCPAFVADCLETLEEIGIRAREEFVREGGEELSLVPSLNAAADWVAASARLVRAAAWTAAA